MLSQLFCEPFLPLSFLGGFNTPPLTHKALPPPLGLPTGHSTEGSEAPLLLKMALLQICLMIRGFSLEECGLSNIWPCKGLKL